MKLERDTLFAGNLNIYHKATSKYCKSIGIHGGFHTFRSITYQTEQNKSDLEESERIEEIARLQNHSLETARNNALFIKKFNIFQ